MAPLLIEELLQFNQEFQRLQGELTEFSGQVAAFLQKGLFAEAEAVQLKASERSEAFFDKWSERLSQTQDAAWWKQMMGSTRASLMLEKSQVLWHQGKLPEARRTAEQALLLLGDEPDQTKASLLQFLGGLCQQLEAFDEAESYYLKANREFSAVAQQISTQPDLQEYSRIFGSEAARSLSLAAHNALAQGERQDFLRYSNEAIQLAQALDLKELLRELWIKKFRYRLDTDPTGESVLEAKKELAKLKALEQDPAVQVDILCLEAQSLVERGAPLAAEKKLREASIKAQSLPLKMCSILQQQAAIRQERGSLQKAIEYLEKALDIARKVTPLMSVVILTQLIPLRLAIDDEAQQLKAAQEMEEIRDQGGHSDLALALLSRAFAYVSSNKFDLALQDIEEAKACAPTWELRHRAFAAQAATLGKAGRKEEALAVNQEARALLGEQMRLRGKASIAEWTSTLRGFGALYAQAAFLAAELGEVRQALALAEEGKALGLQSKLERAGLKSTDAQKAAASVSLAGLCQWLAPEKCSLLMYCLTERGTLALLVDPRHPEPQSFVLALTESELQKLLPTRIISEQATEALFKNLPELSQRLLWPLRRAVNQSRVLYIIPDASLYFLPFGALTFEDGSHLIQNCALAYAPSAAVLQYCRSRRRGQSEPSCLAIGVGGVQNISFARQAAEIAQLGWAHSRWLPEASGEQFFHEAPKFNIIHIACHGLIEESLFGTLSASQLAFADKRVSAHDIHALQAGLAADLVFLNACTSGRFISRLGSEIGGFWEAFLLAGASSLISTLTFLDPEKAHQLARDFYQGWLQGGISKAEALRRAQLGMIKEGVEPRHWASHILIGDYR
jgi:CHAT domain-containing protein